MTTQVSYCYQEHCRAAIYRLRNSSTQNPAPIDAAPTANGNCRIDLEAGTYDMLSSARLAEARAAGEELHVAHRLTCPDPSPHGGSDA